MILRVAVSLEFDILLGLGRRLQQPQRCPEHVALCLGVAGRSGIRAPLEAGVQRAWRPHQDCLVLEDRERNRRDARGFDRPLDQSTGLMALRSDGHQDGRIHPGRADPLRQISGDGLSHQPG